MTIFPSLAAAGDQDTLWPARPIRLLNMSTGPVEVAKPVLDAQFADLLTPHTAQFWSAHDETTALLGRVLRTKGKVLMLHGSIRTGIDLALGNVITPGDKILCIINGYWGELIAQWSERHGAIVTRVKHGATEAIDLDRVAAVLRSDHYSMLTIVHVETNSGLVNPIEEIGKLLAGKDTLYFVDTACSAGAMRVETDLWGIDIQTTGSHKCLSSVPGLAVVTVSDKAWARLSNSSRGSYFEFRNWWRNTNERVDVPPFTQPTTLVLALREALKSIDQVGLEQWWRLHHTIAGRFMASMREFGFDLLLDRQGAPVDRELYSDTVIAVRYPDYISDERFRSLLLNEFGIFVIGNVGEFEGRSFRVGLMSEPQLQAVNIFGALSAFREAAQSHRSRKDFLA